MGTQAARRATGEPSLVELLTVTQRRLARGVAAVLAEDSCTLDEWRVLRALNDGDGHLMGALSDSLAIPHPSLTRVVDGLTQGGLVYRRQSADDRRKVSVHLSREGTVRLRRLDALVTAAEAGLAESRAWTRLRESLHSVNRL